MLHLSLFPFSAIEGESKSISIAKRKRQKTDKTENRRRAELVGWTVVGRTDERTSQFFATPENPPFAEQITKLLLSSGFRAFLRVKASSSCSYTYKRVLALRCPRYLHQVRRRRKRRRVAATAAAVENNNGRPAHNADSKTQRDCRLALLHILRVCVRNGDRERRKIA